MQQKAKKSTQLIEPRKKKVRMKQSEFHGFLHRPGKPDSFLA